MLRVGDDYDDEIGVTTHRKFLSTFKTLQHVAAVDCCVESLSARRIALKFWLKIVRVMTTLQVTIRTFLRSTWKERTPNTDWSRDCMEQR